MWKIEWQESARKSLRKLDKQTQERILRYLKDRIQPAEDPQVYGKGLTSELSGYWRYRVGDYRIVCKIFHETITIVVVDVDHRKEIYH